MHAKILFPVLSILLVLSACSPAPAMPAAMTEIPVTGGSAMMASPTAGMMTAPAGTPEMPQSTQGMMAAPASTPAMMATGQAMTAPAWLSFPLTRVTTGETFSVADFKGKVVLVENMAIWCTTCLAQEKELKSYLESLGADAGLTAVGLDIDPNENATDLKAYAEKNAFGWSFAVAPRDVANQFGSLYGDQFLNPPSAPVVLVDRKGLAHPMPFGVKSAADLQKFIQPFLNEGA